MFGSEHKTSIKWHPSIIIGFIAGISAGLFYETIIIYSIVMIHEYGHVYMAKRYGWHVQSVTIWLFGGIMATDEYHSRPMKEQLLVTMAGPIQHVFMYIVMFLLSFSTLVDESLLSFAMSYNQLIFLFNLVPIWPLDGGKIYNLILNEWFPFKRAYAITLFTSFSLIASTMMYTSYIGSFSFNRLILASFLVWQNYIDWKQRAYLFKRFLIGRYQIDTTHLRKRQLWIHSTTPVKELVDKFHSPFTHIIHVYDQKKDLDEMEVLAVYFNQSSYNTTVKDCVKKRNEVIKSNYFS